MGNLAISNQEAQSMHLEAQGSVGIRQSKRLKEKPRGGQTQGQTSAGAKLVPGNLTNGWTTVPWR